MKTKLLFTFFTLVMFGMYAQTTHNILWGFNSNPGAAGNLDSSRTIEVGDTVMWTWDSSGSHNIDSQAGSAQTFNSGSPTSAPNTFSVIFTVEGTNDYECNPHSGSMFGTITVIPTLGVDDIDAAINFKISPNPVASDFNVELPNAIESAMVEVYDVLGKRLFTNHVTNLSSNVDVTNLNSGIYLVRVSSGDLSQTKRIIKQ